MYDAAVIVDAMGGDHAPAVPVAAALRVCREHRLLRVLLVGDERLIADAMPPGVTIPRNLEIVHAPEQILMDEPAAAAARLKQHSSMHVGMRLLVEGKGDAFFTVGNTGAAVAVSHFVSGPLPGIFRPALAVVFPTLKQEKLVLLDLGATADVKSETLFHFALLGQAFSHCITGLAEPRVKILSVGEEGTKGKTTVIKAAEWAAKSLNYRGFVEGNLLFKDPGADVVVTDGFTGNISLKVIEGLSETLYELIRAKIAPHRYWMKVSGLLFKALFGPAFQRFDYTRYGSAVLLGINHLVGIGHGRSNIAAFRTGILTLARYAEENLQRRLVRRVERDLMRAQRQR